jgi:superoxide dismutase, Fe-Mn family
MKFELPPLPYAKDALAPYIGAETVEVHYEKHHRGYLKKLQQLIGTTPLAARSLEEIVTASEGTVYNNAAQVWNHTFYWRSMKPGGGGDPQDALRRDLEHAFGSLERWKHRMVEAAETQFGSGYVWLEAEPSGRLVVRATHDAVNPLSEGTIPLAAIDLWEHAYYLDYHNERTRYVQAVIDHLLDWDAVAARRAARPGETRDTHEAALHH